jgi:acetyltransferase-like isoleucine patch superfamily enzyme
MTSLARKVWRSARALANVAKGPTVLRPERIHGLEALGSLHPTAHLSVWPESDHSDACLTLGRGVYVGKDVEIAAIGPGAIEVGADTSFQDRCQIYGDIEIGAHCIFARNILVISTEHKTRLRPEWIIRDQDELFASDPAYGTQRAGRKVRIEDDCWLGWGSTVMPGVYIGRGAVIGANTVVTKDIAPYEIHGGSPNRKLGTRMAYAPPEQLDAANDGHIPYFYRGFRLRRSDLKPSRAHGFVQAEGVAEFLLAGAAPTHRMVEIAVYAQAPMAVAVTIGGHDAGEHVLEAGDSTIAVQLPSQTANDSVPEVLRAYTCVTLQARPRTEHTTSRGQWGVRNAGLLN